MKKFLRLISSILAVLTIAAGMTVATGAPYNEMKTVSNDAADKASLASSAAPIEIRGQEEIFTGKEERKYSVNIPAASVYNITLCFRPVNENTQAIDYSVKLDGEYPFAEAENILADCIYENDGEITKLSTGDQIAAPLKHISGVMEVCACDKKGVVLSPLEFHFSAGIHTISVTSLGDDFVLYGIKLTAPYSPQSYSEYKKANSKIPFYKGEQILIEGESAAFKNAYSLSIRSDTESSAITPASPDCSYLNYIGGTTWREPWQEISWIIDVPRDGLYKIGASFKQSTIIDGSVYRSLKIDGKIPFKEAAEINFDYSTGWQFNSFDDENGDDYLFYLTGGEHTLSLMVTLSDVAVVYNRLEEIVNLIGNTYLDIVMITGETPDTNRDYELHKQIPDFEKNLKKYKKLIDDLSYDVNHTYNINGELDGALKNMSRILGNMTDSLYNAHLYIGTYYSYYQTLCSWIYDIKNMSLSLDKLIIAAPMAKYDTKKPNAFEKMRFTIRRFLSSFSGDYNVVSLDSDDAVTLKLWVNWGRDQVKALNSLIRRSFSPQSGINVRVEQVNATLIQGVVSDNSPDVYLHLSKTEPVNLAMRGVIYDLSKFDDFNKVISQFTSGAEIPYKYRNGIYALPDTQTFNVMFYRRDILEELGIKVPATWQEFLTATAAIQRKNMNTYLPYTKIISDSTVNVGAGGLTIYPTLLLQKGGSLYNDEGTATALKRPVAVDAFKIWTDLYKRYGLNVDANFNQRFRVGTIPLGVASYVQYMTFAVSAPEIQGRWEIAEIPGFLQEDGTISNICAGGGTGCVLMNSSDNKDEAWEFLKWWVSADTQYEYSSDVESVLGVSGRVSTSNIEALSRFSWDKKALSVILSQLKKVREIPEIPGSYYVSRAIDQAFWAVYNGIDTPKEAIYEWADVSDKEIARKIGEYANKIYN